MDTTNARDGRKVMGDSGLSRSRQKPRVIGLLKLLASAAIILLVASRISALDADAVWTRIADSGCALAVVLLPALCALAVDTAGLCACVRAPFTVRSVLRVLPARFACDSLCNALPGGVAIAEPVRSVLLARAHNTTTREGVGAMMTAKVNMAASQAIFLGLVGLAIVLRGGAAEPLTDLVAIQDAVVPALFLLGGLCAMVIVFYSGWCPAFLTARAESIGQLNAFVRQFSRESPLRLAGSVGLFFAGWVFGGLEAYAILVLLGADASVIDGLLLEGTASLLRIAFFFLPSAVGAAEVGYATLIAGLGIQDPLTVAAAFIAVKRSRELLWIAGGFLVLLSAGGIHLGSLRDPVPGVARIRG
jgi:hypothetical protein